MRQKRSIVWKASLEEFRKVVESSTTLTQVLGKLKLAPVGGNLNTLKRRLEVEDIDWSHIPRGMGSNKGRNFPKRALPLDEVMVENSAYNPGHLKARLIKDKLLKNECALCKNPGKWLGKPLVLRLDHKNGNRTDHRGSNLRLLCPNCDSQTDTFCGRRKRYIPV